MADYYSLLARAIANLPKTSPPSARRAIYERARKALTNQLRSLKPQLPESDIAREERALDDAVARLEADFEPVSAEVHALPVGAGVAEPAEAAEPEREAPPPPPPPPPILRPPVQRPPLAPRPPIAPLRPPVRPQPAATTGLPTAAAFRAPPLNDVDSMAPSPAPEPRAVAPERADAEPEGAAPTLGAPVQRYEREPARPVLNEGARRKSATWPWVLVAVAAGFAGSIAVVAWLMRPALQDLTVPAPVDSPVVESTAAPEKSVSRVGQATTPTPTAAPTVEASATPTPTPTPVASATPTATPVATPTVEAQPTAAPPPSAATVPIASRAAMLVATVADAAKPAISVGTAVWTVVPAPPGQPQGIGVKAEIDIPDLKMHASMIMRKNFDASLPASHTIDLRLTFDPAGPVKGVKDIALPLMRRDDPPAADALAGVRVKISDNYFLIGLNRGDADITKNLQEIGDRGWFDFPMQLDDDRIAKLTFEKGADGDKIVAQALAAWK